MKLRLPLFLAILLIRTTLHAGTWDAGNAIYSHADVRFSGIRETISLANNTIISFVEGTPVGISSLAGWLYAKGDILFADAEADIMIVSNSYNYIFQNYEAGSLIELDTVTTGGAHHSQRDIVFSRISGNIIVDGNTLSQDHAYSNETGSLISEEVNLKPRGAAFYSGAVFSGDGFSPVPVEGSGIANDIHLERNALLHFAGSGEILLEDPVSSGNNGGISLRKTDSGTVYFLGHESEINGTGKGTNAIRVEGGTLHVSSGASLALKGNDAVFQIGSGGALAGGGVFKAENKFVVTGALSPDSMTYTIKEELSRAAVSPSISGTGSSVGVLTLGGNAQFSGGVLATDINMRTRESDKVIIDGHFSGTAQWSPIPFGEIDYADLSNSIVVFEVHGAVEPGAKVAGSLDVGLYKVRLASGANPTGPGTAWWTNFEGDLSSGVDAVLNTAGSLSGSWFRQLDNLAKRMGELRISPCEFGYSDLWVRTYGQQSDIDLKINGINDFREYQYGVDMGADRIYRIDSENKIAVGIFGGYQRMDRRFHDDNRSKGDTDSVAGGVYLTWMEKNGWYADLVIKGQSYDNTGRINGNQSDKFDYSTWGIGASAELGKTFAWGSSWFAEPMIQAAWLHLDGKNYATRRGMNVQAKSSDAWQFAGMARVGRTDYCGVCPSHFVQTYFKAGIIQQVSGGGAVHMEGRSWRPNADATRGVAGLGIIWQYERHQVHFDFEAGTGEKVDIPWSVNLGYRVNF